MLTWFARDDTPILNGPRVVLRPPRLTDYAQWHKLRRTSRDFLRPFEPIWHDSDLSQRAYNSRFRRGRREAIRGTDYAFFVFLKLPDSEQLVGGITLSNLRRRAAQWANLGYWMGRDHAGQGLMTEAVGVVLPFAFRTLGLHRIHAAFMPHNIASRRVLEKNGFEEEGYAENYLQINGKWADHVLFGLTRERWDANVKQMGR